MLEKTTKENYYHVYSRGTDKNKIFLDEQDYKRFLNLLKYCNRKNSLSFTVLMKKNKKEIQEALTTIKEDLNNIIIATLMPNHFHIFLKCLEDNSAGVMMQKILNSYAKYFNRKYKKLGRRFENTYRRRRIDNEYDFQNVIDYIYNNPAKLLDRNYDHKNYLAGVYKMSEEQKEFVKNYPYTYKGPTFNYFQH